MLDVEVTDTCNFRCIMCPTGNRAMKRPSGFMSQKTFDRIIEEAEGRVKALRFIGWGEPTLNKELVLFISKATEAGLLTHLNTNGSKINQYIAEALVDSGLTSIKFSFQGVDRDSYAKMRKIDFFNGMLESINQVGLARGNHKYPFIAASTTTTDETPEQIEGFVSILEPMVDQLSIGKTIFGFIDMKAARLTPTERVMIETMIETEADRLVHPDPCPEVFDKLTVQWDGSVRVCCNDYNGKTNLGNINTDSLLDIWTHPVIEEYRDRLAQGDYGSELCKTCWSYLESP